jgi:hypothetical protein
MRRVIITPDYTFYATQAAGTLSEFTEHYYFLCILSAVNQDPIMRDSVSCDVCTVYEIGRRDLFPYTKRAIIIES